LSSTKTQPTESSDLKNYLRSSSAIALPKVSLDLTVANVERQQQRARKQEPVKKNKTPLENREYLKKFPSLASVGCEERDSILGFIEELEE
jgi:hypothetical protein